MKSAETTRQASCVESDDRVQTGKPQMIRFEPKATVYSDSMPDIREVLPWVPFDTAASEAATTQRPMLAAVVAPWSTGAHLLYRELGHSEVQAVVTEAYIPVLIDPANSLAQAATIAALAGQQGGASNLPLLAILTPEGNPVLAWSFAAPEHRPQGEPTTLAILQSVSEQWSEDVGAFDAEWNQVKDALVDQMPDRDQQQGGFEEGTKQLHAYALADVDAGDDWLQRTLASVWKHGVRDQLEPSFHPATRDSSWVVPFFEKVIPQNAAMALAYARVANQTGDREIRGKAQDLVRFCLNAFLQDTDVISAESAYYTWLSPEAYDAVGRQNLQAVSLLYGIQPSAHRQVLSQIRTIDEIRQISFDSEEDMRKRILAGNAEMLMHRRTRPAPPPISMDAVAWRASTYAYLMLAMDELESSERSLLTSAFVTWLEGQGQAENIRDDVGFQNQVSLLWGLLIAKSHTSHAVLESVLPSVLNNVRAGTEYWSGQETHRQIWLHQHDYLPSIASMLASINASLPEGEPPLSLS